MGVHEQGNNSRKDTGYQNPGYQEKPETQKQLGQGQRKKVSTQTKVHKEELADEMQVKLVRVCQMITKERKTKGRMCEVRTHEGVNFKISRETSQNRDV